MTQHPTTPTMPPSRLAYNTIESESATITHSKAKETTVDQLNSNKLEQIHQALPESTTAERTRFLTDRKGDTEAAIAKLGNYLQWRKQYCDDTIQHLDSWKYATQLARRGTLAKHGKAKTNMTQSSSELPCTLYMLDHEIQSTSKNDITTGRYLQHFPARIDSKLADTSIYALALAIYLDRVLDRNSTEKVTLVIDVRPGYGWANIKAIQLLPFIQSTVRNLCDLFPTRLNRCVIYPVPSIATALWKAVKPFVGKDTVKKVCLVTGPAGKNDKIPKKLNEYLDNELIGRFEQRRKDEMLLDGR